MWKRSTEPIIPAAPPAPAPELRQEVRTVPAHLARSASLIGETMLIQGEVVTEEDLQINGRLEGDLRSTNRLSVGSKGKLEANIRAREADIEGTVQGNIDATERIVLRKGAHLTGDVRTSGITIEDGAFFKGGIDIARPQ